jgi:hypothetical protein
MIVEGDDGKDINLRRAGEDRTMKEYRVTWEIDIDADSPEEAAQKALDIQRNPESMATVFDVFEPDEEANDNAKHFRVDLMEDDPEERVMEI